MKKYDPSNTIKQWAEEDRPREKLLNNGRKHLSLTELFAILLGTGSKSETAVDLAKKILGSNKGNLHEISRLSLQDLMKFKGVGKAKAVKIIAALELASRKNSWEALQRKNIMCSRDVYDMMKSTLNDRNYEQFWTILLNRANKVIRKIYISEGGLSGTVADPRKIFKKALENHAASIILCHNHPSGNVKPSDSDIRLTKKLVNAGKVMDIDVLDHVIVAENSYFSFADENIL
ncbi:MAG: DNA repair protein RadC [Bacteroidales bacterium]